MCTEWAIFFNSLRARQLYSPLGRAESAHLNSTSILSTNQRIEEEIQTIFQVHCVVQK